MLDQVTRQRTIRQILLESALIVFSILLALFVSEWVASRKEAKLTEQALRSIELEIRENMANVERALPYQKQLSRSVQRVDSIGTVRSFADFREQVPEFSGYGAPSLLGTAWRSAIALGALQNMGFDTVAALSRLYHHQDKLDEYSWSAVTQIDFSDAAMPSMLRKSYVFLETVIPNSELLLEQYRQALNLLAQEQ